MAGHAADAPGQLITPQSHLAQTPSGPAPADSSPARSTTALLRGRASGRRWETLLGPGIVGGLGTAVAMWCLWFVTHLPALGLPSHVMGPALLLVILAGGAITAWLTATPHAGTHTSSSRQAAESLCAGALSGLIAGLVNLLIVGSKIVEQPAPGSPAPAPGAGGLKPDAWIILPGFLALSAALGFLGALIAKTLPGRHSPAEQAPQTGPHDRETREHREHRAHPEHHGAPASPSLALPAASVWGLSDPWLARLGLVTAAAFVPLILIGGLVTSTASGMAVPDWPGSYGANMFLYPISLMSHPRIFLEHSHRLFGSMVGLATLVLMVATVLRIGPAGAGPIKFGPALRGSAAALVVLAVGLFFAGAGAASRGGETAASTAAMMKLIALAAIAPAAAFVIAGAGWTVRLWVLGVFLAVCAQGYLGGRRVTDNSALLAMLHGVGAQVIFAVAVALAARLAMPERPANSAAAGLAEGHDPRTAIARRRVTTLVWLLLGLLFIQLIMGATYRHMQVSHALWTHVGLAIVVVIVASVTGAMLGGRRADPSLTPAPRAASWWDLSRQRRIVGVGLSAVVGLQFVLGWAALGVVLIAPDRGGVPTHEVMDQTTAIPVYEALLRTAHQANGALLLGLAAWAAVLARRV